MIFVIEVDNEGFKVFNTSGAAIDPATQATAAAIQSAIEAIRDTAGIKKITDALPSSWMDALYALAGRSDMEDALGALSRPGLDER